jgi:hypothetical protein
MIGVGLAGLLGYWNAQGILVDEYITATLTITDLQTIVVFLFGIVGAMIGVNRR